MNGSLKNKGPWFHRIMISFFSVLFGVLVFWLLSFIDRDMVRMEGPNYSLYEKDHLDQALVIEHRDLTQRAEDAQRQVEALTARQGNLRDRTDSLQKTMNQLLDIHRLNLEKNVTPTEEEQQALAESESQFLSTQQEYDQVNKQIATLTESKRSLDEQIKSLNQQLEEKRKDVHQSFADIQQSHRIKVAIYRLSILIPIFLVALFFFFKARNSSYALLSYSFGIAVFLKLLSVLHDYFPTELFKYILITLAIFAVIFILVSLIRTMIAPKKDWLMKQYREAYEKFVCPVCGFPIRRGPLRYLYWNRRSAWKLSFNRQPAPDSPDEPYTCPSCGTRLFEECPDCHSIRHAMLPNCDRCGAEKEIA